MEIYLVDKYGRLETDALYGLPELGHRPHPGNPLFVNNNIFKIQKKGI